MPVPAIAFIAAPIVKWAGTAAITIGSMAGATALSTTVSAYTAASLTPSQRKRIYSVNKGDSNLLPEISDLLSAYYGGTLEVDQLGFLLKEQGAQLALDLTPSALGNIWHRVIEARRPVPPLDIALRKFRRRTITPTLFRDILMRHGFSKPEYFDMMHQPDVTLDSGLLRTLRTRDKISDDEYHQQLKAQGLTIDNDRNLILSPAAPLDPETLREMLLRNVLDRAEVDRQLKAHGWSEEKDRGIILDPKKPPALEVLQRWFALEPERFDQISNLVKQHGITEETEIFRLLNPPGAPAPGEVLDLLNRGKIDEEEARKYLHAAGMGYPDVQEKFLKLRNQIPPYSDLTQFALKEAWDPNVVQEFGYDEEFPPEFQYWMERQGYGWQEPIETPAGLVIPGVPWPQLYWRAHWRTISPDQAYAMLHRFRPVAPGARESIVDGVPAWTMADVNRVLKIHDYPPAFRARLAGLSFRVNRLIDIRWALEFGVRERPWAVSQFLDRGHRPDDAEMLADIAERRKLQRLVGDSAKRHKSCADAAAKAAEELYRLGVADRAETGEQLTGLGREEAEIELCLNTVDVQNRVEVLKLGVRRIKSDYLAGRIDRQAARLRLDRLGVKQGPAETYLNRWDLLQDENRRVLTTNQIVDMVERGLLAVPQAVERLSRLGWTLPDQVLLMASAAQDVAKGQVRQAEKVEMNRRRQAAEAERLIKQGQAQVKELQTTLRRLTPITDLKKWGKSGIISEAYFRSRLGLMGYTTDAIELHAAEVRAARGEIPTATVGNGKAAGTAPAGGGP